MTPRTHWEIGGPDMAPQPPQGSEPPGEAVALLDTPTGSSLAGVVPGGLGRREGCPHVLGPDTDPDEPGGNPPQKGEAREEADGEGRLQRPRAGQDRADEAPLRSEERRGGKECRSRWSPYH